MILGFPRPEPVGEGDWRHHDTIMAIRIEALDSSGNYQPFEHHIRFSRSGGEGVYTPSDMALLGEPAAWLEIDPLLLT
ncbi:hypothetical protein Q427_03160 [Halomonas sp. BC04]|nr:hypothetical protein Q427_03160 [Halomonas sp. BC04]